MLTFASARADELRGKVVSVSDGDTITVLDNNRVQHKIRLNGIDAPESSQEFGQASTRNLSSLIFGQEVVVTWQKIDRYGRLVGNVFLGGKDINLEQLKAGLAWYFRQYEREVPSNRRATYAAAEAEARQARRELWSQPSPPPPWEFRHPDKALSPATNQPLSSKIIGNRNSNIYHRPDCPDYNKVSEQNRIYFGSEIESERAGFMKARNCP